MPIYFAIEIDSLNLVIEIVDVEYCSKTFEAFLHKRLFLTHFSITGNACLTLFVLILQKANSKASWITILQTNIQIYDRSKLKILSKCYGKTADKVTWPMEIDSPWIILPRCCHVPAMSPSRHSYIFVGWKSNQGEEEEVPSPKNSSFFIISKFFKVSFNLCYQNSGQNWQ